MPDRPELTQDDFIHPQTFHRDGRLQSAPIPDLEGQIAAFQVWVDPGPTLRLPEEVVDLLVQIG